MTQATESVLIEIIDTKVNTRSGVSQRNNKPYEMHEQMGYLHKGTRYPVEMKLTIESKDKPYQPGMYRLSPDSFYIGNFGDLQCRPVLLMVSDVKQVKAS